VLKPFPRLTHAEAMARYGTDKPDLRYGLQLANVSDMARDCNFQAFRQVVDQGGVVKGFVAPGCAGYSRRQLEELTEFVKARGAKGLVTMALAGEGALPESLAMEDVRSAVARYFTVGQIREMARRMGARRGDLVLLVAGDVKTVNLSLSQLRMEMARRLKLADRNLLAFAFIVDFPLFEWNEEEKRWDSAHHPFTSPLAEDMPLLEKEPGRVRSQAYDLVCNEYELASGSIRIHNRELQERIFRILGYSPEDTQARFGHMLEAFEYGAPPHGGIAPGIDRLVMILAEEESLREVIAFPKTQNAVDLLFDAPSAPRPAQLRELHLRVVHDDKAEQS
jgi:aspartyl-tRNA synthetase